MTVVFMPGMGMVRPWNVAMVGSELRVYLTGWHDWLPKAVLNDVFWPTLFSPMRTVVLGWPPTGASLPIFRRNDEPGSFWPAFRLPS
ncbi:hypothetical protein D3C71_1929430 [compost metagenome]